MEVTQLSRSTMLENSKINELGSEHFEAIFFYATIGILLVDKTGKIEEMNPFALKIFGYREAEIKGQHINILIPAKFHRKHDGHQKKYIKDPKPRLMGMGLDLFAVKKDGSEFPVEISLSSYSRNGENFTMAFIADITERKESQAEIEKLNNELENKVSQRTKELQITLEQLQTSRKKLEDLSFFQKAILDNAGAMIVATDKKGLISYCNPAITLNTGYSPTESIRQAATALFFDKKEIEDKRNDLFLQSGLRIKDDFSVLVERATRNPHKDEQYSFLRKDQSRFPVMLYITPIKNYRNEVTGFMFIAIDVTERIRAEDELRAALEKEKELNELKSRFVTMASHEFRTPLSTVLSSAYLIDKYTTSEEQDKRERHLQRIISSVNMLTTILNDFLNVGKIEEGKIQVHPVTFNVKNSIGDIIEEIKNTLKKGQQIVYEHKGKEESFLDPSLLKHIILNLVSNAGKFSPEDSRVEIKTKNQEGTLTVTVKDNGIGISKEDQKHLMERFFRGANAGNIQGTGLGLHIISKYAELMNGKVKCKSILDKGTSFEIIFKIK
jgi:PAS domain S-box-containing protein